jgi:hypothetical protein
LCAAPPPGARYRHSGEYFQLCDDNRQVHADWLQQFCAQLPGDARYDDTGRFRRPCAEEHDIRLEWLDELDRRQREPAPRWITWPVDDGTEVPPAFFIEEPDPLPEHEVSGYPLSIQFNPAHVKHVEQASFTLTRIDVEPHEPVLDWLLLDRDSDPNDLLTSLEFAYFPLKRLAWGARYEARFEGLVDGRPLSLNWQFRTAGKEGRLLELVENRQRFELQPGKTYRLYLPPAADQAYTAVNVQTRRIRDNHVDIDFVDPNTLDVVLEARWCLPTTLTFDDGREAELVAAGCR